MMEFAQTGVTGGQGRRQRLGFKSASGTTSLAPLSELCSLAWIFRPLRNVPAPARDFKHLTAHGIDDGGENRSAVLDQSEGDHPIVAPLDEGAGSIDGIDDPDATGMQAIIMLGAFFREPSVTGTRALEPFRQQRIHCMVRFRHRRAIGLPLLFNRPAPIAQRELSGLLSGIADKIEVLRVSVLHTS